MCFASLRLVKASGAGCFFESEALGSRLLSTGVNFFICYCRKWDSFRLLMCYLYSCSSSQSKNNPRVCFFLVLLFFWVCMYACKASVDMVLQTKNQPSHPFPHPVLLYMNYCCFSPGSNQAHRCLTKISFRSLEMFSSVLKTTAVSRGLRYWFWPVHITLSHLLIAKYGNV